MRGAFVTKAISLVSVHLLACAAFLLLRQPERHLLEGMDRRARDGEMFISSGAPLTYLADRPLRSWSSFHGGESRWIKLGVILNGPALVFSSGFVERFFPAAGPYHEASWLRAKVFGAASLIQWLSVASLWQLMSRRAGGTEVGVTPN
jgi:hypothetical protein